MTIVTSVENARGCGYRKAGKRGFGVYLVGPAGTVACGALPVPLDRCPTCDCGVKPSRAWTWIDPTALFASRAGLCAQKPCLVGDPPAGRHGLLWVGGSFYASAADFILEARQMGVSRKLAALPRWFRLGETVVYLAHRAVVPSTPGDMTPGLPDAPDGEGDLGPGVFSAFRPIGVDVVVETDDEAAVPEEAKRLVERVGDGARLIRVVRAGETRTMHPGPAAAYGRAADVPGAGVE